MIIDHPGLDGFFKLLIYGPTTAGPTIDSTGFGSKENAKFASRIILWRLGLLELPKEER